MKTITIDGLQIPTDKLIAAGWKAPEEKKSIVWKPVKGECYYYIDSCGNVLRTAWGDDCSYYDDISRSDYGNIYKSFEEVQRAVDLTKATVRVNRRIEELNDGWVADWKNDNQKKWYIVVNKYDSWNKFSFSYYFELRFSNKLLWIASGTIAEIIIKEMHDDLYTIFGVERGEQI